MKSMDWKVNDWIIYRKQKRSDSPGPRAKSVYPDENGDKYTYIVEKYWVVKEVKDDGSLLLVTHRGKQHNVPANDPRLRAPSWWERVFLANRFRQVSADHGGKENTTAGNSAACKL